MSRAHIQEEVMNAVSISRISLQLAVAAIVAVPMSAFAAGASKSEQARTIVVPMPINTERVLLSESFDNYDPHWRQVRGHWALVEGNLLQARDDARELNAVMFNDSVSVADADITTEVSTLLDMPQVILASDDELLRTKRRVAGAGLVFRYQDEDNFYLFRTAGEEGVVLGKVVNGEWHELANPRAADFAGVMLKSGTPYTLRVRIVGNRIQAWIGDRAVANIEDDSLGTGRIGLATFRSKASFSALRIVER
jgi:hypothetical protein